MGFGVSADLLDALTSQIGLIVGSSAFVYIVGTVLLALFLVSIFGMIRDTFRALGVFQGIDAGYSRRVVAADGSAVWAGRDSDKRLLEWGYKRVGRRTAVEDWALIDDVGNEIGERVSVEFYESYKK